MSITETTTTSWFSRLKNGLLGLLVGPLLVFGMIWLLSWNEGRSVNTYNSLVEGAGVVVSIDSGAVDAANEGKLVYISGPVTPQGVPEDQTFGVQAQGAAGLNRTVEMYQWVEDSKSETKKTLGGGEETVTTYSYRKEWQSRSIDSSDFRDSGAHQNPSMPFESERFWVSSATLGAFTVDGKAVADLGADKPLAVTPAVLESVSAAVGSDMPVKQNGTTIYVSQNRQAPAVGDLRISFSREDIATASFVGAQRGDAVTDDFKTSNDRTVFLTAAGNVAAPEMFEAAQSENTLITWLIRFGGLLGMFIGFAMMLSILGIIADVIPFVGSIVGFGTSVIALVLTLLLGPLVIALAWIAYRPLIAIAVLALGVALAAGLIYLRRKQAPAPSLGRPV
ncbi:putative membrane protein (Fun14 family) [Pararhizobium capsulatum DSM 1112]|uniref:Membrane protein (Fun14 family) n=1 Tax=Pararhizobium capsulatum DSM 1112 TaxID=1121113 RepID=A0ABU0BNF6_9HYPH|nr:TMEM43 family protein [Pararhizobium capsulatum]MDQ0318412.1 putative membrane protein (Fun14 family) [Pararhizobium capsulatum DSM 1112]